MKKVTSKQYRIDKKRLTHEMGYDLSCSSNWQHPLTTPNNSELNKLIIIKSFIKLL